MLLVGLLPESCSLLLLLKLHLQLAGIALHQPLVELADVGDVAYGPVSHRRLLLGGHPLLLRRLVLHLLHSQSLQVKLAHQNNQIVNN